MPFQGLKLSPIWLLGFEQYSSVQYYNTKLYAWRLL
jgi:hypothetical protein